MIVSVRKTNMKAWHRECNNEAADKLTGFAIFFCEKEKLHPAKDAAYY